MTTRFTFTKLDFVLENTWAKDRLTEELKSHPAFVSSFNTLKGITKKDDGSALIKWKHDLTPEEEAAQAAIVAAHEGIPLSADLYDPSGTLAMRMRKSTSGALFRRRFISFTTAEKDSKVDKQWDGTDFSSGVYMRYFDGNGLMDDPTQEELDSSCIRTTLRLSLSQDIELDKGRLHVPLALVGKDIQEWGMSLVGAPDIFPTPFHEWCPLWYFRDQDILLGQDDVEVQRLKKDDPFPGVHELDLNIFHPVGAKATFLASVDYYLL